MIQPDSGQLPQPSLSVWLRQSQASDLDYVLAAEQDPDNCAYVFQWSRQQHLAALDQPDFAHLIVETGAARVGYVILLGLQDINQSIALGRIVITEKGKGYGKAAIEQVKQLAFHTYGAHRLWLDVKTHNTRAQAVYRATGFVVEGILRDCLKTPSGYESLMVMSILRQEYLKE